MLLLKTTELARQTLESGLTPVSLRFYRVESFDGEPVLLRSVLVLESLDLGVLEPQQYRFVARRTKQGQALVERHLEKLLEQWLQLPRQVTAVTVPVFPRVLLSGQLTQLLFHALARHPGVDPARLCIECSADILFEDFPQVQQQWQALRKLGVKLAISEVGDDFCPLTRLSALAPDYVFADAADPAAEATALALSQYIHLLGAKAYLPFSAPSAAQATGFDGHLLQEVIP